jgi:hypothetical protein
MVIGQVPGHIEPLGTIIPFRRIVASVLLTWPDTETQMGEDAPFVIVDAEASRLTELHLLLI